MSRNQKSKAEKRANVVERKRRWKEREARHVRCCLLEYPDLLPDALVDLGLLEASQMEDPKALAAAVLRVVLLAIPEDWRTLIEERVTARDSENG